MFDQTYTVFLYLYTSLFGYARCSTTSNPYVYLWQSEVSSGMLSWSSMVRWRCALVWSSISSERMHSQLKRKHQKLDKHELLVKGNHLAFHCFHFLVLPFYSFTCVFIGSKTSNWHLSHLAPEEKDKGPSKASLQAASMAAERILTVARW